MAAGTYNFIIEQGATLDFEIQYKDSNGDPIDLTGCWGAMQIRSNYADNNPTTYITLTTTLNSDDTGLSFSGSVLNPPLPPTSGSIGVYISSCTSSLFNFNNAIYDLEIYSGDNTCPIVTRLLEGQVQLSKEITRIV
jgi:hypothetical protein